MISSILQSLCHCKAFEQTVLKLVQTNGGSREDAEDLIQESLTQLAINLVERKYKGESSIENYAFGICRFKWMNVRSKKRLSVITLDTKEANVEMKGNPEKGLIQEEQSALLWKIVRQLSGKCPEFLKLWALGYSHKEMSDSLNVSEKRSRKTLSKCRQKLRQLLQENNQLLELFKGHTD